MEDGYPDLVEGPIADVLYFDLDSAADCVETFAVLVAGDLAQINPHNCNRRL